jgi:hypothetical protein
MKVIAATLLIGSASAFQAPFMTVSLSKSKPKSTVTVKKLVAVPKAAAAAPAAAAAAAAGTKKVSAAPKAAAVVKKAAVAVAVKKAAPVVAVKKAAPVVAVKKAAPVVAVKKAAPVVKKAAPAVKRAVSSSSDATIISADVFASGVDSVALPLTKAPYTLDGSLVGDVGFDPFGFSTIKTGSQFLGDAFEDNLKWYREAELMHGRIAMMAALGFVFPGLIGTLPGNEWTGVDAYSYTNPLEALYKAPGLAIQQIFCFMAIMEFFRIKRIQEKGASYEAGDFGWGQGEGRWNPYKFNYTPEEYKEKQLQELKNGRLAMMGVLGLYLQANASGEGVIEQLKDALNTPGYYAKAGYFFPEGI